MRRLVFAGAAWDEYVECQSHDKRMLAKLNTLFKEILHHPTEGAGRPEQLRGSANTWSRRVNEKDRLVYEVSEDEIVVKQCRGHYSDK